MGFQNHLPKLEEKVHSDGIGFEGKSPSPRINSFQCIFKLEIGAEVIDIGSVGKGLLCNGMRRGFHIALHCGICFRCFQDGEWNPYISSTDRNIGSQPESFGVIRGIASVCMRIRDKDL